MITETYNLHKSSNHFNNICSWSSMKKRLEVRWQLGKYHGSPFFFWFLGGRGGHNLQDKGINITIEFQFSNAESNGETLSPP